MNAQSGGDSASLSGAARNPDFGSGPVVDLLLQGWTLNTNEGRLGFCGVTLINTGDQKILVDVAQVGRRPLILERLAQRGLSPRDIDVVVMTHTHWDHLLNADLFEHAEFVVSRDERAYARNPHPNDWATPLYTNAIIERLKVREVREGDRVAPGLTAIETPGHTVGSIALLVDTSDGRICVSGDALPHARSVFTKQPAIIFDTEEHARQSIAKIRDAAEVFYPGHDRPFRREPNGHVSYLVPSSITISGVVDEGMRELQVRLASEEPGPTWIMPR
jgi:glyoxylase-like metal-dependent hydrolase (beta-lactamase superfamily II)